MLIFCQCIEMTPATETNFRSWCRSTKLALACGKRCCSKVAGAFVWIREQSFRCYRLQISPGKMSKTIWWRPPASQSPPPPRMGWVQNLRFSYIFMEPAKTHGIYTVLTSSASETVVFAAFCNTTLYTTTLIVLLLQKQQQLLLLLPLLRTTTYYYVLRTYYYVLLRTTTYYYVLLRTTTYYVLLRTTTYYYVLLRTTTYYVYVLRTYYYVLLRIRTTYVRTTTYYVRTTTYYYVLQMVRPPPIMCICSIFVCIHNKNDIPTLRAHVHTYIQTNHKSIQTKSSHT